MPIYEYKCERGHVFDVMQRMSDDPVSECQDCGAPVHRVFHPVAVHFKGSGFYNTDYGTRRRSREAKESGGESGSASDSGKSETSKSDSSKSEGSKSESSKSDSSKSSASASD